MGLPAIMASYKVASQGLKFKVQNELLSDKAGALGEYAVADAMAKTQRANVRLNQESKAITLEQVRRSRQGARERSSIQAAAAESGLYGGSQQRAEIASIIQEAEDISILESNRDAAIEQTEATKLGIKAEGQSRLNEAKGIAESAPTGLEMGLTLLGDGMAGYSQGERLEAQGTGSFGKSKGKPKSSLSKPQVYDISTKTTRGLGVRFTF